jgi:hypothetical protein
MKWANDYPFSWYWYSFKLVATANPSLIDSPTNLSFVNFIYKSPNTPAIKYISDNAFLLSSVMDSATSNYTNITIEGNGNATLIFDMPDTIYNYSIYYDNIQCSYSNCTINQQQNGEINLTLVTGTTRQIFVNKSNLLIPPSLNINSPIEGFTYSSTSISILLNISSYSPSGLSSAWWSENNGTTNHTFPPVNNLSQSATTTMTWDQPSDTTKTYLMLFCVNDIGNNINCTTRNIKIYLVPTALGGGGQISINLSNQDINKSNNQSGTSSNLALENPEAIPWILQDIKDFILFIQNKFTSIFFPKNEILGKYLFWSVIIALIIWNPAIKIIKKNKYRLKVRKEWI